MPPSIGAVLPRYLLAILLVLAVFLLKVVFNPLLGSDAPYLLTFGAIMFMLGTEGGGRGFWLRY